MRYISHMTQLLSLKSSVYEEIMNQGLALRYCMINVFVAGLIYGVSSAWIARLTNLSVPDGESVNFSVATVVMVGISVAFLMHAGATLFIWVFCKGLGGCAQFMLPYLNLGIACIAIWPLVPVLSAAQAGLSHWTLHVYIIILSIFAAAVCYGAVKCVSGLSSLKMSIAILATFIYVGCFLYLWL